MSTRHELYKSLIETLSILSDEETAAALRRSIAETRNGHIQDADEVVAELGW
jgi:PHD/YefM family antitoxin component YafN of YafNO toxin-antitoxin module